MEGFENFNVFYWALGVFAIGLTIKNVISIKNMNREREFANTYSKSLRQDEDAYEAISNYVEVEKLDYLKNKARFVLIYEKLAKGEDVTSVIDDINIDPLFKEKGSFKAKLANRNSDVFVWLALIVAKAKSLSMLEVIDKLQEKISAFDLYLKNQLEYRLFKGVVSAAKGLKDEDSEFLMKLINGDYAGMVYEKRLVGLYKRIAASYLVYTGETIDEYYDNDLHGFGETLVGKCLMNDLGILDKYPPLEENKEETEEKTEEKTENEEE